jgi:hypothetical protein
MCTRYLTAPLEKFTASFGNVRLFSCARFLPFLACTAHELFCEGARPHPTTNRTSRTRFPIHSLQNPNRFSMGTLFPTKRFPGDGIPAQFTATEDGELLVLDNLG